MKSILVSACLLGTPCRYDGKKKPIDKVIALKEKYHLIPICPEILGGLPTPRTPCEIVGEKVINKQGEDKTAEYIRGADEALRQAVLFGCDTAVLKAKSPSCGVGEIYDGSFSKILIKGDGITARLLKENGIKVINENEIDRI